MSLYDKIKVHLGKTDAEIAAIPGLMDEPRKIPVWQIDELAQATGLKARLRVATTNSQVQANPLLLGAVWAALDLFDSKFDNLDLTVAAYRTQYAQLTTALSMAGLLQESEIEKLNELGGVGRPNPTEAEVAAARAEGVAREAKESLNAWLVGKYNSAVTLIDEGKTQDEVKAFLVA